jgi:hypothetical protein
MLFSWLAGPIADDHSGCPEACAAGLVVEIRFFLSLLKVAITQSLRIIDHYQPAFKPVRTFFHNNLTNIYQKFTKNLIGVDTAAV